MSQREIAFPNLDGLRFLAFFSVFLAHAFYTTDLALSGSLVYRATEFVTGKGIFGVNFFFVLSGFLITYLLLVEKKEKGTVNVRHFYVRRFLRIWPLYYTVVFFGFFVLPLLYSAQGKEMGNPGQFWLYALFLSNFDTTTTTAILGILWSVSIEEQFYLLWPVVFFLLRREHHPVIFYAIIVASWVFRIAYAGDSRILFSHTLSCISDMAVGGLGAHWAHNGSIIGRLKSMPRWLIVAVYLLGSAMILSRASWNQLLPGLYATERLLYSLLFLFVVLEQNYADNSWFKMSQHPWISRLGTYTYGLYMLHFVSIYAVNLVFDRAGWNRNLVQLMVVEPVVAFAGAVTLAVVSFHVLETPFLNLKKRFSYIVRA
jgi:peptidoglycan/LPS O-acetylase OafA/YrhL